MNRKAQDFAPEAQAEAQAPTEDPQAERDQAELERLEREHARQQWLNVTFPQEWTDSPSLTKPREDQDG